MTPFPAPIRLGERVTRWRLSDLERYEALRAGNPVPPPRDAAEERYLPVQAVARRYCAAIPTVWRWAREQRKEAA